MTCFTRLCRQCYRIIFIVVIITIALITGSKAIDEAKVDFTLSSVNSASSSVSKVEQKPLTKSMQSLAAAQKQNPDSVAWLSISGTDIDEVVVQATDNNYYLRRTAMGKSDIWGCYFADCYSNLDSRQALNTSTIIYGHSDSSENPNEKNFTQLFHYLNKDFLQLNQFIILTLPQEELIFQVRAVFFTDISFDYINPNPQGQELKDFLTTVNAKNEFIFNSLPLAENDKFLLLSTCAYRYDTKRLGQHRLVVLARLLGVDETPALITVDENPNPIRPTT